MVASVQQPISVEQINKIIGFMSRVDMKGQEAGEFMACIQALHKVAEAIQQPPPDE